MYSPVWSPGLRQGDILGPLRFPMWNTDFVWTFAGGLTVSVEEFPNTALVKARESYVAIVSHDCEFNEGKRTHFLVARIDTLHLTPQTNEFADEARRTLSNDIAESEAQGLTFPVDTFFLSPLTGHFPNPSRVNFTTITPLPIKFVDEAVKLKRAELLHLERARLRRKLGYFLGRDAEDIPPSRKAPPRRAADGTA